MLSPLQAPGQKAEFRSRPRLPARTAASSRSRGAQLGTPRPSRAGTQRLSLLRRDCSGDTGPPRPFLDPPGPPARDSALPSRRLEARGSPGSAGLRCGLERARPPGVTQGPPHRAATLYVRAPGPPGRAACQGLARSPATAAPAEPSLRQRAPGRRRGRSRRLAPGRGGATCKLAPAAPGGDRDSAAARAGARPGDPPDRFRAGSARPTTTAALATARRETSRAHTAPPTAASPAPGGAAAPSGGAQCRPARTPESSQPRLAPAPPRAPPRPPPARRPPPAAAHLRGAAPARSLPPAPLLPEQKASGAPRPAPGARPALPAPAALDWVARTPVNPAARRAPPPPDVFIRSSLAGARPPRPGPAGDWTAGRGGRGAAVGGDGRGRVGGTTWVTSLGGAGAWPMALPGAGAGPGHTWAGRGRPRGCGDPLEGCGAGGTPAGCVGCGDACAGTLPTPPPHPAPLPCVSHSPRSPRVARGPRPPRSRGAAALPCGQR